MKDILSVENMRNSDAAAIAGGVAQEETGAVSMIASDTVRYLPQAIKKEADLGPI